MPKHLQLPLSPLRVYRFEELDECPERAIDAALNTLAEQFEPREATEWAVDCFNYNHKPHGLKLQHDKDTGPFWNSQGGASLTIDVDDFATYLDWRQTCNRNTKRRLLWLHDQGDISLQFLPRGKGNYCGTKHECNARYSDGLPDDEGLNAAIEWLESDSKYAAVELESEFGAQVTSECEFAGSREQLEIELQEYGRGITSTGEMVELSECEETETETEN